jgi:hypothetical protein
LIYNKKYWKWKIIIEWLKTWKTYLRLTNKYNQYLDLKILVKETSLILWAIKPQIKIW